MDFLLLGPVELRVAGRPLPLGGPRLRSLLAALAVDAGHAVPVPSLIDRVWGEAPPSRAQHALHVYIGRLRGLLAGAGDTAPARVVRRSGGYALEVEPDRVDVHRFRRLVGQARDPECPDRERVAILSRALDLWRGAPLANLPDDWAVRVGHGWQQQRLAAALSWAQACLRLDEPAAAVARLTELVGEHPTVESLVAMLMRVLHGAGRSAEALDRYDQVRRLLADQLGADPGEELQRLHRQLLTADRPIGTSVRPPVPRQLPARPPAFTGRARELAELDGVPDASTVVVTAIDGMAGIGKTALAIHAAHQLAPHYPDGQLFVDLHGYTVGMAPVEPADALDRLLRGLGVPGEQIPADLDARAALYRSRLADQKVLVLLDNAAAEDQLRPLLPGTPGCLVLATSRRRLTGLDQTHTLSLDTLPRPDAVALFTRTVGGKRLASQPPDAVAEVVELCGRLPLAIRIAAARLRSRPTWDLAHLVDRLRDQRLRLTELEAGQRSIIAALDLSYRQLAADQQRSYRLLGLHPGTDIDPYAAASLVDTTVVRASRVLDQLLAAHLLQEHAPGRFALHDLVRAHAADTAVHEEPEPARRAAIGRLLDYYRHTASVAMDTTHPHERDGRPQVPPAGTPTPELADPAAATGWLDTELPNLLAAARHALDDGWPEQVCHLSATVHGYLRIRGSYRAAETLHWCALQASRATGDRTGELAALVCLGHIHRLQGRTATAIDDYQQGIAIADATGALTWVLDGFTGLGQAYRLLGQQGEAMDHYQRALAVARTIDSRSGVMDALTGLAAVHLRQGRQAEAIDSYQQALSLARAMDNRIGIVNALHGLGYVQHQQGRYDQALESFREALAVARATGHRTAELNVLCGMGDIHRSLSRHEEALDHCLQALDIARITGHRSGEAGALRGIGDAHRSLGRYELALDHYRSLLQVAREIGSRNGQFEALHGQGRVHDATGRPAQALDCHREALALASEIGQPLDEARAHDGLAHTHVALHDYPKARQHWQRALKILTDLGVDHTEDTHVGVSPIKANLVELYRLEQMSA